MDPSNILSKMFDYISGTYTSACDTKTNNEQQRCTNFEEKVSKLNSINRKPKEEAYCFPSSSLTTYQPVFNMNSRCYENVPISVDSVDGAEQPIRGQYSGNMNTLDQSEADYSFPPPPCTMGPLYSDLVNMVETSLVQSVCHASRLEYNQQNRQAAEVLAASSLNPNAKEFKPQCPENSAGGVTVDNSEEEHDDHDQHQHHSDNIASTDEEHHDGDPEDPSHDEIKVPGSDEIAELSQGIVKQLTCDSDLDEKEKEELSTGIDKRLACNTDLEEEKEDEEETEEEEDSDWDTWDSDEENTSVECVDVSEFEDLFQVNLLVPSLTTCHKPTAPANTNVCVISAVLRDINQKFLCLYPDAEEERAGDRVVRFSEDLEIILEPESLAEELQEARTSDLNQRRADRERLERVLGPVLTKTHRENMFRKIYGESL